MHKPETVTENKDKIPLDLEILMDNSTGRLNPINGNNIGPCVSLSQYTAS